MKIKFKHLFYSLKSKYLFSFFSVLVFQTFVGDFHQRLQNCLKIFIIIGWTLSKKRLHTSIQDLNIVLSLNLEMLLTQKISVVIKRIVFEGFPEGYPAGCTEQIYVLKNLLPRQLAVLRIILLI